MASNAHDKRDGAGEAWLKEMRVTFDVDELAGFFSQFAPLENPGLSLGDLDPWAEPAFGGASFE